MWPLARIHGQKIRDGYGEFTLSQYFSIPLLYIPQTAGLAVRRVVLRSTSNPTSMDWQSWLGTHLQRTPGWNPAALKGSELLLQITDHLRLVNEHGDGTGRLVM